jgi:MFS family permease
VGVVVARRQPRNPVGWVLLIFTLLFVLGACASYYAVLDYHLGHRGLPLAAIAVLVGTVWAPSFALFPVVILLFPDGRLGRRWRPVLWAYAVLVAYVLSVVIAPAIAAVAGHDIRLNASGNLTNTSQLAGWLGNPPSWLIVPVLAAIVGIGLSFVARQVLSWRRASGERRQQLKWLACGAAVAVGSLVLAAVLGTSVLLVGIAALPASIGVGILKYRLYEIDRIISRTLAYAIVTGLLIGVYAGLVLLATRALPVSLSTPVAVACATLVAAALFNPLRRRVQRAVDRRFNRSRYDADQMVAAFAARLKGAADLDAVGDDLANVVRKALEPEHMSVWISQRG